MTREQRMARLRQTIDLLGAMGCVRSQRSVITDLAREHAALLRLQKRKRRIERHIAQADEVRKTE